VWHRPGIRVEWVDKRLNVVELRGAAWLGAGDGHPSLRVCHDAMSGSFCSRDSRLTRDDYVGGGSSFTESSIVVVVVVCRSC